MTKKQKFKKAYGAELFRIACTDLDSANLLFGTGRARPETVVFHVQQAVEKSIKAVLCHLEIPVLLVHDIGALLGGLPDDRRPPYDYALTRFNDFAGILRYEEGKAELEQTDVQEAINVGQKVLDWAGSIINP